MQAVSDCERLLQSGALLMAPQQWQGWWQAWQLWAAVLRPCPTRPTHILALALLLPCRHQQVCLRQLKPAKPPGERSAAADSVNGSRPFAPARPTILLTCVSAAHPLLPGTNRLHAVHASRLPAEPGVADTHRPARLPTSHPPASPGAPASYCRHRPRGATGACWGRHCCLGRPQCRQRVDTAARHSPPRVRLPKCQAFESKDASKR